MCRLLRNRTDERNLGLVAPEISIEISYAIKKNPKYDNFGFFFVDENFKKFE